jgi:hypothetical protein
MPDLVLVSPLQIFRQELNTHVRHIFRLSHRPSIPDHPSVIRRRVEIVKLFIMLFFVPPGASLFEVGEYISHQYVTTAKTTVSPSSLFRIFYVGDSKINSEVKYVDEYLPKYTASSPLRVSAFSQKKLRTAAWHRPAIVSGSLVTMAWRILILRLEESASRYGGLLRIY